LKLKDRFAKALGTSGSLSLSNKTRIETKNPRINEGFVFGVLYLYPIKQGLKQSLTAPLPTNPGVLYLYPIKQGLKLSN